MTGDYEKCNVGDFILLQNSEPSFKYQNDVYYILKKENGRVDAIRCDLIFFDIKQHGFITALSINPDSKHCTLITNEELMYKVNSPDYSY